MNITRPDTTPADIEVKERAWWQKFAEIEDKYCWVQTPAVQRTLRRDYLKAIIDHTPADGRILELGCGTGWLCRLLAELGKRRTIVGIDFSEAQIALARQQAVTAGLSGQIQFICADGTAVPQSLAAFDTVIIHGFLHHLNRSEIQRALLAVRQHLKPEGNLFIFEPFRQSTQSSAASPASERLLRELARLANRGRLSGWRTQNQQESEVRALIAQRHVGVHPFGPSPKEMPFSKGELEAYMAGIFLVQERRRCMAISHLIVQEWLLRAISHPRSSNLLLPLITRISGWLDQRLIAHPEIPAGIWTFDMLICEAAPSNA
ncbi:MAG: hypothetical protein K0R17_983 [Rariglobus sp.]|jgi:2-polyprenyl-3-methyl-5-hydroxy-6-metoxy-1,4-benzoquinol methylase|nr:hypothetical protein [Rariglobus sp.]